MSLKPIQTATLYDASGTPSKETLVSQFKGRELNTLRTPAFVIDRHIFASNCARMLVSSKEWGASFRAHVKTHKVSSIVV
jgi:D-serine deaminase-like pyridoxal phosphate-dependent protein